jgi:hypothetical protein
MEIFVMIFRPKNVQSDSDFLFPFCPLTNSPSRFHIKHLHLRTGEYSDSAKTDKNFFPILYSPRRQNGPLPCTDESPTPIPQCFIGLSSNAESRAHCTEHHGDLYLISRGVFMKTMSSEDKEWTLDLVLWAILIFFFAAVFFI